MVVIRIGPRSLALLGMVAALVVGMVVGSLRPVELVTAASRTAAPPADVLPAPEAQTVRGITLDQAFRLVQAGLTYAAERNYRMSFVVLDTGGYVVASARMDGADFYTVELARGKAYASAATGLSSAVLNEAYLANPGTWGNAATLGYGAPLIPARGALPIVVTGVRIGAMGASGGPNGEDENAVRAAMAAVGLQ